MKIGSKSPQIVPRGSADAANMMELSNDVALSMDSSINNDNERVPSNLVSKQASQNSPTNQTDMLSAGNNHSVPTQNLSDQ